MPKDSCKTNRFRPQISLRTLMIVVTLLAMFLGLYVSRAQRQQQALAGLNAAMVIWDFQCPGGDLADWDPAAPPPYPEWLRTLCGDEFFGTVRGLIGARITDDDSLSHLAALTGIETLNLAGSPINVDAMRVIARLPKLRTLNLDMTRVDDEGLVHLARARDLEELSLNHTSVTAKGLFALKSLPRLRHLQLEGVAISKASLRRLRQTLPDCEIWGPAGSPQEGAELQRRRR